MRDARASWTTANEDELRQMCADQTLNDTEIDQRLSPPRSRGAVTRRKEILGLSGTPARIWSAAEERELSQLKKQGPTLDQIRNAMSTQRTYNSIRRRLKRLDLRHHQDVEYRRTQAPQAWPDEDIKKLRSLQEVGTPVAVIAEAMSRTKAAIYSMSARIGGMDRNKPGVVHP